MLLVVVGILSLYLSGASKESLVLDISKAVNTTQFYLEKVDNGDVSTHKYIPRSEFDVLKVVDGECVIWDGTSNDERCTFAVSHLSNYSDLFLHLRIWDPNKLNKDLYYEKKDGTWQTTVRSNLPSNYRLDETSYEIDTRVKFDLSSEPEEKLYNIKESLENGMKCVEYSPKLGVNVTSIMDGNNSIWKRDQFTKLFQISMYYIAKTPCLLELTLERNKEPQKKYFENKDSEWVEISELSYAQKMKETDFDLPRFDINHPDLNKFEVREYEAFGVYTSVYTPVMGTSVHSLVDGNMPIWESKVGDYVDKIWLYSKGGEYITTQVRIVGPDKRVRMNNYRRLNGEWKLVLRNEL